jgi:hypothetical protein
MSDNNKTAAETASPDLHRVVVVLPDTVRSSRPSNMSMLRADGTASAVRTYPVDHRAHTAMVRRVLHSLRYVGLNAVYYTSDYPHDLADEEKQTLLLNDYAGVVVTTWRHLSAVPHVIGSFVDCGAWPTGWLFDTTLSDSSFETLREVNPDLHDMLLQASARYGDTRYMDIVHDQEVIATRCWNSVTYSAQAWLAEEILGERGPGLDWVFDSLGILLGVLASANSTVVTNACSAYLDEMEVRDVTYARTSQYHTYVIEAIKRCWIDGPPTDGDRYNSITMFLNRLKRLGAVPGHGGVKDQVFDRLLDLVDRLGHVVVEDNVDEPNALGTLNRSVLDDDSDN